MADTSPPLWIRRHIFLQYLAHYPVPFDRHTFFGKHANYFQAWAGSSVYTDVQVAFGSFTPASKLVLAAFGPHTTTEGLSRYDAAVHYGWLDCLGDMNREMDGRYGA